MLENDERIPYVRTPGIMLFCAFFAIVSAGAAHGEFVTEFDPDDQAVYWVSATYAAEAVRFAVGEGSVTLDEVRLHYDAADEIEIFVITTLPDTTEPSLLHRTGTLTVPAEYTNTWMSVDLRSEEITVQGEFWIYVKNLSLMRPPGISLRGMNTAASSSYCTTDTGWSTAAGNMGVGIVIDEPVRIDDAVPSDRMPGTNLLQNHPNPFNPLTVIPFEVGGETGFGQPVCLSIYDARGKLVRNILQNRLAPGAHRVTWNGRNDHGERMPSGTYLIVLKCGDLVNVRKTVLCR